MKILHSVMILFILLAAGNTGAETPTPTSTAADQTDLELTVYTSNMALVTDTRRIDIPPGRGELRFEDVAARIMPDTVYISAPDGSSSFRVFEQIYSYDLINETTLLDRYLGKPVKIIDYNRYQDRKDILEATLLGNRETPIYRIKGEIFLGHPGIVVLPDIPETLTDRPTLTWFFEKDNPGPVQIETSYLTEGITWEIDYLLLLSGNDKDADLSAWASLDNRSGLAYRNVRVSLVAGETSRVKKPERDGMAGTVLMARSAAAPDQFEEAQIFEYHRYDLERLTTIEINQTRQIGFFDIRGITVEKEYLLSGSRGFMTGRVAGEIAAPPVEVFLSFRNRSDNNLGMPLPAGVVRLYQEDEKKRRRFIGEDRTSHTPRDGLVRVKAGNAFDVTAERKQVEFKQISSRLSESTWEISVQNHKVVEIVVGCLEQFSGNWEITGKSHPFTPIDAFRVRFDLPLSPGEKTILRYTVRTGT